MSVTEQPTGSRAAEARPRLDPRGPRTAAALTSVVLALVLLLPQPAATILLAVQVALFALGSTRGVQRTPAGWLFRTLVRPRLGPPAELEDPEPLRFAQTVGLAVTAMGLVAFLAGAPLLGLIMTGLALVAALLNAVVGLCLGCELYLIRTPRRTGARER